MADYLAQEKYKHDDALRIRLSIDMMLLKWRDAGLDGHPCRVGLEKHMMQRTLVVTAQGVTPEIRSAIEDLDDSDGFFSQVLNTMGLDWSTIFDDDVVYAQIPLPRRHMSGMKSTLLAIMFAIVADLILLVVPQEARSFVMDSFVDPIYTTIVGALSAIVGPFIFISLVSSIVGMGSLKRLKTTGGVLIRRLLLTCFLACCIAAVMVDAIFGLDVSSESAGTGGIRSIVDVVLGIVPTNLVDPFLKGNTLQIVFLGVLLGVALLALSREVPAVTKLVLEFDLIIRWVLGLVLLLLPLFIFLAVLRLAATIDVQQVIPFSYAFLAAVSAMLIFDALYVAIARMRTGTSVGAILRACGPGALIALTTTSSAAAYWTYATHMEHDLGLAHNTVNFSLPLGIPLYQPGYAQYLLCLIAFVTAYEGGALTPSTLIVGIVFCVLLGIATPPVPGGVADGLHGAVHADGVRTRAPRAHRGRGLHIRWIDDGLEDVHATAADIARATRYGEKRRVSLEACSRSCWAQIFATCAIVQINET